MSSLIYLGLNLPLFFFFSVFCLFHLFCFPPFLPSFGWIAFWWFFFFSPSRLILPPSNVFLVFSWLPEKIQLAPLTYQSVKWVSSVPASRNTEGFSPFGLHAYCCLMCCFPGHVKPLEMLLPCAVSVIYRGWSTCVPFVCYFLDSFHLGPFFFCSWIAPLIPLGVGPCWQTLFLFKNILIALSLLKHIFTAYGILVWWLFSFSTLKIPLHCLLASPLAAEKYLF